MRKVLITTPIFYANAKPHIGHLYTVILSDYTKKIYQLFGYSPLLSTGTDEHGMKIYKAARKAGYDTLEFCDINAKAFEDMLKAAKVDYDVFTRTTSKEHKEAVIVFWKALKNKIRLGKHIGYYSSVEEAFVPENEVMRNYKERIYIHTKTGNTLNKVFENNYLFPLGEYREQLKEIYDKDKIKLTQSIKNQILAEINSLTQDVSISRPRVRVNWGLTVPDDEEQSIYVWLDALVNYYTALKYPITNPKDNELYSNIIHIIGKDIIRFHSILWPAFLLANDYPLPREIITHNFWLMDGNKISKSLGNVVSTESVLKTYGSDLIRWHLLKQGPFDHDEIFLEDKIVKADNVRKEFANTVTRIMSSNPMKRSNGLLLVSEEPDITTKEFVGEFNRIAGSVYSLNVNPTESIGKLISLMRLTNRYIDETRFWTASEEKVKVIVGTICEALKATCVLLYPVVPEYILKAIEFFGIRKEDFNIEKAKIEIHKGKEVTFNYGARDKTFIDKFNYNT